MSERWGIHLDTQWRRHDLISDWQQYVIRPGANFALTDSVTVTAGYLFGESFPYGDFPSAGRAPEHRLFQQAIVQYDVSERLALRHRFLLEQRFLGNADEDTDYRLRNRFRYQFGATTPIADDGKWYVSLSEEFMFNFGNHTPTLFDQNRAYAGLGRKAGRWGRLETGYLHQLIHQSNGFVYESNHTLQLRWISSAPLRAQ